MSRQAEIRCEHEWRPMTEDEAYPASSGRVCIHCDITDLGWLGKDVNEPSLQQIRQERVKYPHWRARIDLREPAEMAIRGALIDVEAMGAHPLLTDAVVLLDQAHNRVMDFIAYAASR